MAAQRGAPAVQADAGIDQVSPERAPLDGLPDTSPQTYRRWAWPGLCAVLALLSGSVWLAGRSGDWAWQPIGWPGQAGLLWSAPLAPESGVQWVAGALALLVLAVLGQVLDAGPRAALAALLAWPLGTAGLGLWPAITSHAGMSGQLCGLWAVLGVHAVARAAVRPWGLAMLAMLAAKLLTDQAWWHPVGYDPAWGDNLHYAAHLSGALAGLASAWAVQAAASRNGHR